MDEATWQTVSALERWLAEGSAQPAEMRRVLQILKLSEEAGEVAEAVIGVLGANPRKGRSHSWDDVSAELCDVIITAMVALLRVDADDPAELFRRHLAKVADRVLPPVESPAPPARPGSPVNDLPLPAAPRTLPGVSLRFHEIAEASHRILNPFTPAKLELLGELCRLTPGRRILDLACGKGELLSTWAAAHGTRGVGVDISTVFLAAARERAAELEVADAVDFVQADAGAYRAEPGVFDVVSCLGATWIGGGLVGTLELMKPALAPDGLLLVGEPFLHAEPPAEAYADFGVEPGAYSSLPGLLPRFEEAGCELLEMVLADPDSWDRYEAAQWRTLSDWLRARPDDPDAPALRAWLAERRHNHLAYRRPYLGWGVFVLRPTV